VLGRLGTEDVRDTSAVELVRRIGADNSRHSASKQGAVSNAECVSLPQGWLRVKSDELLTFVTSGSRGWAAYYASDGATFLRIGNLDYGTTAIDLRNIQHVRPPIGAEGSRTVVREGDILISITGDTGMVGLVPKSFPEAYINQHIALARPSEHVNSRYLAMFFTSSFAIEKLKQSQRGIKNSLSLRDIREVPVFLPPFEEQSRIVAKVDWLLATCEQLKAQLNAIQADNGRLLEAVLNRALSSA
jgi:type I restriction enzyme, S subunit